MPKNQFIIIGILWITQIKTFISIVGMHPLVFSSEMSPLEPVNGAQVALLPVLQTDRIEKFPGAVRVPDVHVLLRQFQRVGGAADEPQQFLGDAAPEHTFRGQQREHVVPEGVAHLGAEDAVGADTRAVFAFHSVFDYAVDVLQVLVFLVRFAVRFRIAFFHVCNLTVAFVVVLFVHRYFDRELFLCFFSHHA